MSHVRIQSKKAQNIFDSKVSLVYSQKLYTNLISFEFRPYIQLRIRHLGSNSELFRAKFETRPSLQKLLCIQAYAL